MITLTPAAADQIRKSASEGNNSDLPLRIAAKRETEGNISYAMGFADKHDQNDLSFNTEGVTIVIAPVSLELIKGMTIDFVELEAGQSNFIFLNPNDPSYVPPEGSQPSTEHHL
jgi:iron-sulfur cluster assembly protein